MKKGVVSGIAFVVLVVLLLVTFGMFASHVAKEASLVDDVMKQDLAQHMPIDEVKKQLAIDHFEMTGSGTDLDAVGKTHTFLFYSTHLTLKLGFDADGKMTSYHLDRQ